MFINDEGQKQVLPILAKATVAPPVEAHHRAAAQLQMNPGQQVKAEIIANLPNNLYLARVAGEMYKLEIPLNVQPGETLEMTFLTSEPRITFQVMRPESGGESVKLSFMGKWLSDVVRNALSPAGVQEPLLEHPAQASMLLASKLKSALTQSGHFYESHLGQWAAGRLQLKELLKEPQGQLSLAASMDADGAEGAKEKAVAGFADSRTLPLIKEQLLLLNSGVLAWQGEAWPGQGMKLTITEGDAEQWEEEIEAKLSLDLPHLGGVEAQLRFGTEGLVVDFVCNRPGSSELLKKRGAELRLALTACGLHLNKMAAKDGENPE